MSKGSVESAGSTQRKRKSSTNQSKITKEPIYIQKTKADNEISNAIDSQCKVEGKTLERKNEGGERKDDQVDVQSQSSEVLEMASGETNKEIVGNTLNSKDFSENEASFVINVDISDGCPPEGDATTPALESSVQPKTVEDPFDSAEPEEGVVRDNINNPSSDERAVVQEEEEKPETINQDYVNPQGVRFTSEISELEDESQGKLLPYGLECIHELLKVLISLCDPSNKRNNEVTIHLGLTLLGVAFEIGADEIGKHESLLAIVKDELCRNLFSVGGLVLCLWAESVPLILMVYFIPASVCRKNIYIYFGYTSSIFNFRITANSFEVPIGVLSHQIDRNDSFGFTENQLRPQRNRVGVCRATVEDTRTSHRVVPQLRLRSVLSESFRRSHQTSF